MKKHSTHILFILSILLTMCACAGRQNAGVEAKCDDFPLPKVPSMLEDNERLEYIAEHYWNAFTDSSRKQPCIDTSVISGISREILEQAVSNFAMLMAQLPLDKTDRIMSGLAGRLIAAERADTSSNVLEEVTAALDKYLYDPNSPLRDEDIYHAFAESMASCEFFPELRRKTYANTARKTALNRRGTKATDFSFSERNGKVHTLYGIEAERIILFFSNPGCTACKAIIDLLNSDPGICELIDRGELAVLNIYIDEELDEWYKYMPIYPEKWYNGYDHNYMIRGEELYDVRAIPSLYLLDKDKKVLLKDAPVERLVGNM